MTENKRFNYVAFDGFEYDGEYITPYHVCELLNELHEENKELKEENKYLCEKIKENEWHWNTIDEDRDVWMHKCKRLEEENEQLKQQLAHHTRMHEWFKNEAYLLQNKLDNREDEIRRLKGGME